MNLKQLLFAASFCLLGISADAQFYFFFDYNYNRAIVDHVNRDKERIVRNVHDTNIAGQWYEMRSYDSKNRLRYAYRKEKNEANKTKVVYTYFRRGKAKTGNMYITWKDQFGFDLYEEYEDEKAENLHYSAYTFFKK